MEKKMLYLECYSGISGDMMVGALLDLGADKAVLCQILDSLKLPGYQIETGRAVKNGIDAYSFDVVIPSDPHYDEGHGHEHHTHLHHHHRNLSDINEILERIDCQEIRELAKKIFQIVAEAESEVHNVPLDQVHFHEVGAIDSIVDIVSTAVCIHNLGIKDVVVSELYEGSGYVSCQHGKMPVPAPATLKIAESNGLYLHICENKGEMVTPTGAAIAAALKTRDQLPYRYRVLKTGSGAGKKTFSSANILRAMIIEGE